MKSHLASVSNQERRMGRFTAVNQARSLGECAVSRGAKDVMHTTEGIGVSD
jgi:hypothetical protein